MKKHLSVILVAALLLSCIPGMPLKVWAAVESVVIASARYPESKHPYDGLIDETKTFLSPGAQSLTITFSDKTNLGSWGDYIYLYDSTGAEIAKYTSSDSMAGKDVTIQGDTFSIRLVTDGSGDSSTDYGYSFSSIVAHDVDTSAFCLEIKEQPTRNIYEVGEVLSTAGLVLGVVRYDGSVSEVTNGFTVSGFESQTEGTKTVTVHYAGKTTTFEVYVKTLLGKGYCGKNAYWTLDSDGNLTISGTGPMNDYSSYGSLAPWNALRDNVKKITISEKITHIGNYAFYQCYKPTQISIPVSAVSIGDGAFAECSYLQFIGIPAGANNLKTIGNRAFYNCTKLYSIVIPKGVTSIEAYTFYNCKQLTSVSIPDGLTTINTYAFSGCASLTQLKLPSSVTSIGVRAFENCTKLSTINIPVGVTSIPKYAFYYCSALTSIDLPEGLETIGDYAFSSCTSLDSINIPQSLTSIGSNAFSGCVINRVDISELSAWCNISFLGTAANPLSTQSTYSPKNNFYLNGEAVTDLEIPDGVTQIGDYAFSKCYSLTSVKIPDSVTSIGYESFYNCNQLKSVDFGNGVTNIGYGAFRYCSLTEVTIPDSVVSIEDHAFGSSTGLASVTLGKQVNSIGNYAFQSCTGLSSITIPTSVTTIGNYAFQNCTGLADVYYGGAKSQWNTISIGSYNVPLTGANIHFAVEEYTVTFQDWDCTVLSTQTYLKGDAVTAPADPVRDADDTYTYTFVGWDKEVVTCDGDATYTAIYTTTYKEYTVTFQDWDGTVLSSQIYHYGDAVIAPADPSREADDTCKYIFVGWDKEVVTCAGDAVYTAVYTVFEPSVGDANSDGKVNEEDVSCIMKYLAGWDLEIDLEMADVNGDGVINTKDSLRLLKYLNGYDVTLG